MVLNILTYSSVKAFPVPGCGKKIFTDYQGILIFLLGIFHHISLYLLTNFINKNEII